MTDSDTKALVFEGVDQKVVLGLLKDARQRLEKLQAEREERVAIVGMHGRFPGADDLAAFWHLLDTGGIGLRNVDDDELERAGVSAEEASQQDYVRMWGGFDDPTGFDAGFFGYAPRDAELLDPQQRVFLESAWSALEHAGYDSRRYAGRIGVYAGGSLNDHFSNIQAHRHLQESVDPIQAGLGNVSGMIAARAAYHLDLKGPGVGVQATCATSLVSVHLAVQALRARECDMALAGGVAVGQPRPAGYIHKSEGIGSPDGQCRPFDADAKGTIFTNGVGTVVLKRLSDARADGNTIYAVIRGSAVGNDGAAKVGLTAPSVSGQADVLASALASARIDGAGIDYVEAHGTGTALGDPIELAALNRVYGPALKAAGRECAIGSVKGNVGHMDAAAGMGGLIKTVLALSHGRLPASLNFTRPNPACNFAATPFRVLTDNRDWAPQPDRIRRAAISSFGMGGMNAHLILEEAPSADEGTKDDDRPQLLTLSARTSEALAEMKLALADAIDKDPAIAVSDIAYTLQLGRRPMEHRFAAVAGDRDQVANLLRSASPVQAASGEVPRGDQSLVFLFPGQGVQHPDMAGALHASDPVFRAAFDECVALLPDDIDLPGPLYSSDDAERLNRTDITQPALFVVEYALARMWMEKGLQPRALIGHSIGEYVAACIAGVFSLRDALGLVVARGRAMQACEPGGMLSVALSEGEARAVVTAEVEFAALNGQQNCVLSGTFAAIDALAAELDRRGVANRRLRTSHAFHSFMMEPALSVFAAAFKGVALSSPTIDIVSNLTGDWLTAAQATDPTYWIEQMRRTVLFRPGVERILQLPNPLVLEVGPGASLTQLLRSDVKAGARAVSSLPDATSGADAQEHLLLTTGELWAAGIDIDWAALWPDGPRRRVGLPTYRFQRKSYWVAPVSVKDSAPADMVRSNNLPDWFHQPEWRRRASIASAADGARWLLFGGNRVVSAVGVLPGNVSCVVVEAGETFSNKHGIYTIDPKDPDHYRALLADLSSKQALPDQIVNGFGLDEGDTSTLFESTLALGRALAAEQIATPLVSVLGTGMHRVIGSETLEPGTAMALGVTRILSQEISGLKSRSIDVDQPDAGHMVPGLALLLHTPWEKNGTVCALRGGYVWTQEYSATPVAQADDVPALKDGATYLVSGELVEGLGLIYLSHIVKSLGGRAILLGRAGLPSPQDWDRWLASHSPQHPVSQFIRALRGIGVPGKDYRLFSGDISDAQWVRRAIEDGEHDFGSINGVFLTAAMGEHHHFTLEDATPDSHVGLFSSKIGGTTALGEVLSDREPDFVLVQSSLSTVVGGSGLSAYASANSFLDAFVEERRAAGSINWQVVNWDACLPYGQATNAGGGLLDHAFNPDEVWQATRAVLSRQDIGRAVVTPGSLSQRIAAAAAAIEKPKTEQQGEANAARQGVKASYVAPRDDLEKAVASVMSDLLGIERIGVNDNFFELGGHSLLAIQVITRLRKQFGVDLPMRSLLFEAPTVAGMASSIGQAIETARRDRETVAALLDDIEATDIRREAHS